MALTCERHEAFVYDRGGVDRIGVLDGLMSVEWSRDRDEVTTAKVTVSQRFSTQCDRTIGLLAAGRHELVVFRGGVRVWEGPITHLEYRQDRAVVTARDVTHYLSRMIMRGEYDNSYPNIGSVVERVYRIIRAESVRFEAQVPPINIRQYVTAHYSDDDAGTSSHTLPFHSTVYEHMDNLAARGGLDYTVIGRSIHLWDVRNPALGQTATLSESDFIGDTIITEYGMDLCTVAAMTDGKGNYGVVGQADDFYGIVEKVETAYDEETGDDWDEESSAEPPSEAEMRSQAQRMLNVPPPLVVRVPENSTLNPNGTLAINELVPGIFIPLQASLPGRTVSQMQKLDALTVKESADEGETIQVTLSAAPNPREDPPIE